MMRGGENKIAQDIFGKDTDDEMHTTYVAKPNKIEPPSQQECQLKSPPGYAPERGI
jgi:hypothetical protein